MPRKFLLLYALGAIVLSWSAALLAAGEEGSQGGKPSARTSKESSGGGDAAQRRGGNAPGEFSGNEATARGEARLSDKPAEAERLIETPDKSHSDSDRRDGGRLEPSAGSQEPAPGPSVRDRSSEVK